MDSRDIRVYLLAPNVSAQMGGEAIKALQIFEELSLAVEDVTQITHMRCYAELKNHPLFSRIAFLEDDWMDRLIWRTVLFRAFMTPRFSYRAVKRAEAMANGSVDDKPVIIHQTEPNSPVATRWTSLKFLNVFGPINGNIYYPKAFRQFESIGAKLRRLVHFPLQRLNRFFWRGMSRAELILAAGGDRTVQSLLAGGVPSHRIYETLDCGIPDAICLSDRLQTDQAVGRFIHFGRLVFHKGTSLAIKAVAKADEKVTLDIVGRGPELARCKALASELGITNRVHFLDWYQNRSELVASFQNYSGVILPTFEDANGIVVQESMAAGLVPVCLDWGGPQMLIENEISGFLVKPNTLDEVTTDMASCLDRLTENEALLSDMSLKARIRAREWRWSMLIRDWLTQYQALIT